MTGYSTWYSTWSSALQNSSKLSMGGSQLTTGVPSSIYRIFRVGAIRRVGQHVFKQRNEDPQTQKTTTVFGALLRVKHVIVIRLLECNCSKMLSVTAFSALKAWNFGRVVASAIPKRTASACNHSAVVSAGAFASNFGPSVDGSPMASPVGLRPASGPPKSQSRNEPPPDLYRSNHFLGMVQDPQDPKCPGEHSNRQWNCLKIVGIPPKWNRQKYGNWWIIGFWGKLSLFPFMFRYQAPMGSSSLPQSPPGAVSTSGGRSFFGRVAGFFGFFSAYVGNSLEHHQKKKRNDPGRKVI